ncbi:FRIGIDA-like protein 4a [Tasmannia lanceolata]|uniref:FRIGIDA-like protein 4a n=1 Tax=Tasmannia lanceolata TaxID=3420 RepID=UPI004063B4E4
MATVAINGDKFQKVLENLEAQKTLITSCTSLWKNLSTHFSSLQETLLQKSQTLDTKFKTLDSKTKQTLKTLNLREQSISKRESAAIILINKQKESALSDFEKPVTGNPSLPEALRSLCRKMDSGGLWRFLVAKRKDLAVLRTEISLAIAESVDPQSLVLDAVEDFVLQKSGRVGISDQCRACGLLLRGLFPETEFGGKGLEKGLGVASSIGERAYVVSEKWKERMEEKEGEALGAAEAQMFLVMVVGFGLSSRFDKEFLRKLVVSFPSRRDMPKVAAALGFGEKMGDIIDELVKSEKELEAIYFAHETGLTERFAPVPLLKAHLRNSRRNASTILKNGHHSTAASEEAGNVELSSLRSIIRCVEDHKLESEFTLESLRKRVLQLETAKADRKKHAAANKSQNKRARSSIGGGITFPPAKSGRLSVHRDAPSHLNPAAATFTPGAFNYPSQRVYEAPAVAPYGSPYGTAARAQSPVSLTQQYPYVAEDMGGSRSGGAYVGPIGGSYVGSAGGSYSGYDYGATLPPPYQSSYPQ